MPRGGARPGAGRKPLTPEQRAARAAEREAAKSARVLTPTFGSSAVVPPSTNMLPLPVEEFDAPDSLTFEERQVWLRQAPFAFRNRTLTKATALAFERYCRMVVQERIESLSSAMNGANHRGLRKEIGVLELQFLLAPSGKPMAEPLPVAQPEAPASKLGRFRS